MHLGTNDFTQKVCESTALESTALVARHKESGENIGQPTACHLQVLIKQVEKVVLWTRDVYRAAPQLTNGKRPRICRWRLKQSSAGIVDIVRNSLVV